MKRQESHQPSTAPRIPERLQWRVHGNASLPALIYLPGLHGDWTLVSSFRKALGRRVQFVEFTYPRTTEWSLDDYAANIESALREAGICRGWLLGESFSSQIVWSLIARRRFQIEGVVLAGGFARHPVQWGVRMAQRICGDIPLSLVTRILFGYAKLARYRYRRAPETLASIHEFISRRTEPDRRAAVHRLRLIAQSDPSEIVQRLDVPVFAVSGWLDPIVPWFLVRPWLRRHCPALREFRIVGRADHNVLGTAPEIAAELVVGWMGA